MEDFTVADWRADIKEYFAEEFEENRPRQEGEFTIPEFMDVFEGEITEKQARDWLDRAVKKGDYTKRRYKRWNLYCKVGNGN